MPASLAGGPAVNYESSLAAAGFSLRLSRLAPIVCLHQPVSSIYLLGRENQKP
jgi:hypothetical protein